MTTTMTVSKVKRLFAVWGMLCIALTAMATDLQFDFQWFLANPPSNRTVVIFPQTPFQGNQVYPSFTNAAGTSVVFSNIPPGLLNGSISAPPAKIPFQLYVTSASLGLVNASNCAATGSATTYPAGGTAWSIATSDTRYQLSGTSLSNTFYPLYSNPSNYANLVAVTNIAQSVGGSGVTTATNISGGSLTQVTNIANGQTNGLATIAFVTASTNGDLAALAATNAILTPQFATASNSAIAALIASNSIIQPQITASSNASLGALVASNALILLSATNQSIAAAQNQAYLPAGVVTNNDTRAISFTNFASIYGGKTVDHSGIVSVDSVSRTLDTIQGNSGQVLDWANQILADTNGNTAINWNLRNFQNGFNGSGLTNLLVNSIVGTVATASNVLTATNLSGFALNQVTNIANGQTNSGATISFVTSATNATIGAIIATNTANLTIMTNYVTAATNSVLAAMNATNTQVLLNIAATNLANLTTTTNMVSALSNNYVMSGVVQSNGLNNAFSAQGTNAIQSLVNPATNAIGIASGLMAFQSSNFWATLIQATNITANNAIANLAGKGTNTVFYGTNLTIRADLNMEGHWVTNVTQVLGLQSAYMQVGNFNNGFSAAGNGILNTISVGGMYNSLVGSSGGSLLAGGIFVGTSNSLVAPTGAATSTDGAIIGGEFNYLSANTGLADVILGGSLCSIINASYSIAMGRFVYITNNSVFAWGDDQAPLFNSRTNNAMMIRALNGVSINTNFAGGNALRVNGTIDATAFTASGTSLANSGPFVASSSGSATNVMHSGFTIIGTNYFWLQNSITIIGVENTGFGADGTYTNLTASTWTNAGTGFAIVTNGTTAAFLSNGVAWETTSPGPLSTNWGATGPGPSAPGMFSHLGFIEDNNGKYVRGNAANPLLDSRFTNVYTFIITNPVQVAATAIQATNAPASGFYAGTNIAVIASNFPTTLSTNIIVSTNNAIPNSVGTYYRSNSSPVYFTNTVSHYSIINIDDLSSDGYAWTLWDNNGTAVYGTFDTAPTPIGNPATSEWYVIPTFDFAGFATFNGTNRLLIPALTGLITKAQDAIVYIDPASGNDLSAKVGNPYFKYASPAAAVPLGGVGVIISESPGIYNAVSSGATTLLNGTRITGPGPFMMTDTNGTSFNVQPNTIIENFAGGTLAINAGSTNVSINNSRFVGAQDGIICNGGYGLTVNNTYCASPWDALAIFSGAKATNTYGNFYNSTFVSDQTLPGTVGYNGTNDEALYISGSGTNKFYNCVFKTIGTVGGAGQNFSAVNASYTNGYAEFYNCTLTAAANGGGVWAVWNPLGATLKFYNCNIGTNAIYDPSNRVTFSVSPPYGAVTTNLQFTDGALGFLRTNTLYFTNGWLMNVTQP